MTHIECGLNTSNRIIFNVGQKQITMESTKVAAVNRLGRFILFVSLSLLYPAPVVHCPLSHCTHDLSNIALYLAYGINRGCSSKPTWSAHIGTVFGLASRLSLSESSVFWLVAIVHLSLIKFQLGEGARFG